MLGRANLSAMNADQKRWLEYFRAFEEFLIRFCETQDHVQQANALIAAGRHAEAASILKSVKPEEVIAGYARMVRLMPDDKGQRAMVLRLGYAWLGEIVCLRQMASLEPVRYAFGPTIPEPLAEGATYYNDFFDRDGDLWRLLGEYEILDAPFGYHQMRGPPANPERIIIHTFPSNLTIRAEQTIPAAWRELARHGVIFRQPVPIPLRAINKGHKYSFNNGELRPGRYTVTLLATRKTPGDSACTAEVRLTALEAQPEAGGHAGGVPERNQDGTPKHSTAPRPLEKSSGRTIAQRIELPPDNNSHAVTLHAFAIGMEMTSSGNAVVEVVPDEGEVVVNGVVLSFSPAGNVKRK